jgi:hypothetical protein
MFANGEFRSHSPFLDEILTSGVIIHKEVRALRERWRIRAKCGKAQFYIDIAYQKREGLTEIKTYRFLRFMDYYVLR